MNSEKKQWLAVYTRPRWEKKVFGLLSARGIEAYCPMNKVQKKWSDRLKWIEEPLFKSYVFVHVTPEESSSVRLVNGVINFVYWLGKPAVVKPEEIELIHRFLDEYRDITVEPLDLKPDDSVMITGGALMEEQGKVIKQYGNTVAIEILSLGRRLVVTVNKQKLVRKDYMHKIIIAIFLLGMVAATPSCVNMRKLQYMQGSFDTVAMAKIELPPVVIQKNDLLSIVVYSDNPAATAIYNQSQVGGGGASSASAGAASGGGGGGAGMGVNFGAGGGNASSGGYLVDQEGNIQFQGLGAVHVDSLTPAQLRHELDSSLRKYLQNPYTTVRFLNYKITIIGDVGRPAVYSIPSEKVNILEALGLAGDLNITARRDNLLIIREQNGVRSFGRIDLTRPDIFKSPYFQLKQNDILLVEFTKNKPATADQLTVRNITVASSIITTIALIVTILKQ